VVDGTGLEICEIRVVPNKNNRLRSAEGPFSAVGRAESVLIVQ